MIMSATRSLKMSQRGSINSNKPQTSACVVGQSPLLFTNNIAKLAVELNVRTMNDKTSRGAMTTRVTRGVLGAIMVVVVVFTSMLGGFAEDPAPESAPVTEGDIAKLVTQLGDEMYPVREQASVRLWKLADKALPALRKAAKGDDPEIRDRADELILYITVGLLYDSPEEVKKLVVKFSHSSGDMKLVILRKLLAMGQWKQVLHLAKLEKSPVTRAKMAAIVQQTASRAARDAIAKGDLELAEEILTLSADDPQSMLMLAWFYNRRGQLEEQLRKAAHIPGKKGVLWRMALHRVSGNIAAAITEADKVGFDELADGMRVIRGDAVPWMIRNSHQLDLDVIYSKGCEIQLARLRGKEKRAAQLARELSRLARNDDTSARVTNALAANGYRKEALDLLVKRDVDAAFEYFDATEYPQRSLEVLGIPRDAKPPYTAWVKKFTEHAIEQEDEELYTRLIMLAGFLVSHGQGEHATAVLTPMMTALEDGGDDAWFTLLPDMLAYGLGAEAVHFIEKRGNEDGETDLGVRKMLALLPGKAVQNIWTALKKRNKEDLPKALHEIALLAGVIADPTDKVDALHQSLLKEVADAGVGAKNARESALFSFAVQRNDLALASRMADEFAVVSDRWTASKIYLDAALLRWKKIEPIYAAEAKNSPGNYENLTHLYIASRKLGRDKKADELYERILMLSMGDARTLIKIGGLLHGAGYDEKAVDLWMQAAVLAEPGGSEFDYSVAYLASYAQPMYRKNEWKKAAAIAEVYIQLTMRGRGGRSVMSTLRARFNAEFRHGMDLLKKGNKAAAMRRLDAARKLIPGDGMLADDFFPVLRRAGIGKTYDRWFERSYSHVDAACKLYPGSHNSHNTAAWLAARAVRRLDDALAHARSAIKIRPREGAYLDTMAEVWFAKGDRAKAIKWSEKAVACSIDNAQGNPRDEGQVIANYKELHKQLERFKHAPLPNK